MDGLSRRVAVLAGALAVAVAARAVEVPVSPAAPPSGAPPPEAPPSEAPEQHRLDVAVLPSVNFTTATGLGAGLSGALYVRDPDHRPYKYALSAQLFATTRGVQDHSATFDAPRLFESSYRPIVTAGFFRDRLRPYTGIGNETTAFVPPGTTKDDYLTYTLTSPYAQISLEKQLAPRWKANAFYALRGQAVDEHPGSRLALDHPTGAEGGRSGRLDLELIYDTRDVEASPTSGVYLSGSLHGDSPMLGSSFENGGAATELRGYLSPGTLGPHLVLAGRFMADVTAGNVPVAMLAVFGGRSRIEGLGGAESIRGLPRFRYIGKAKVLANLELRSRLHRFIIFKRPLDLWAAGFVDAGRVWAELAADGPWWRIHSSRGLGARVAWVEDFVVRFDLGFSEGSVGFYAGLAQLF